MGVSTEIVNLNGTAVKKGNKVRRVREVERESVNEKGTRRSKRDCRLYFPVGQSPDELDLYRTPGPFQKVTESMQYSLGLV
jgi:hypothetical protein